jgi:hypothetical protein
MIDQVDERADQQAGELPDEPAGELADELAEDAGERPEAPARTGNDAVDGVLESLEGLDDVPVDEHVAVFERAHEQLRGALDSPRDD